MFSIRFRVKKIYIKRGQKIINEGRPSDCVCIIDSGSVEVYKEGPGGKKQVLAKLREKEIFGEFGLVDGLPKSASVIALEDPTISVLTPDAFSSLTKRNPQALIPILKILANRIRSSIKTVEQLQIQKSKKKFRKLISFSLILLESSFLPPRQTTFPG